MGRASNYLPALKFGHKIYPEDLAGMIGLPSIGDIWYVDPGKTSGLDGSGRTRNDAFVTVAKAKTAMTADQDDVVLITPSSSTGRTSEVAEIDWNKRRTHLIGSTGPITTNPRAGMSFGSAVVSPCFTISTRSCIFKNMTIATFNDINVLVSLTGSYNYFEGVHFAGIGHATAGDDANARCLEIEGAEENKFVGCTFGLDTVVRTGANATVSQGGVSPRNEYIDCRFNMFTDASAPFHFMIENNDAVQRYVRFVGCSFHNPTTASSTNIVAVMNSFGSGLNGTVELEDCWMRGATDWIDDFTHFYMNMGKPDTDEGGILVIGT